MYFGLINKTFIFTLVFASIKYKMKQPIFIVYYTKAKDNLQHWHGRGIAIKTMVICVNKVW